MPFSLPLAHMRVIDLSDRIAGAYCTKLLGDLGASVTKVEPPDGDPLRRWSPSGSVGKDGHPDGAIFRVLCGGKSVVQADPTTRVGVEEITNLAADADILVETWLPGTLERLGLGPSTLQSMNPRLTIVSISPFGAGGPDSNLDHPDFLLQARCGSLFAHGFAEPLVVGGRPGEYAAGATAATAGLAAVYGRDRRPLGAHVDVSILESLTTSLLVVPYLHRRLRGTPAGPRVVAQPVPGIEECRDGYVGFVTVTAQQWMDFAVMIERPDLQEDLSLCEGRARYARVEEIRGATRAWTRERTVDEVVETAAAFRLPVAPVLNGETLPQFEHGRARESFVRDADGLLTPRSMYRFHGGSRAQVPPPQAAATPSSRPLEGVRVLDFTAFWAGPFGTAMLASLGAEVIKVESIQRPDPLRYNSYGPAASEWWWETSPLVLQLNPGKRDITLDLADPTGRELALRLAATADVVIENFTPRVMETFRLTYDDFKAVRPDIIMLRCPAFGLDGPWRERTGFAPTIEQVSGLAWVTGYEDGEPQLPNGFFDPVAGTHHAGAAIAALEHRRRTGEGQLIEISMFELAANITAEQVVEWDAYGELQTRHGNRSRDAAPQGVYRCDGKESWIAVSVRTDGEWAALVEALGRSDWAGRADLRDTDGRWIAHDELDECIGGWCLERSAAEASALLRRAGVPVEEVVPAEMVDEDPHMQARGFWQSVDHPVTGPLPLAGFAFVVDEPWEWYWRHAPLLGQDNAEVLSRVGVDADALAQLIASGVVGDRPAGI